MTKPTQLAVILLLGCAWSLQSQAQFSSGSDESDGALDVAGSMTLALPRMASSISPR